MKTTTKALTMDKITKAVKVFAVSSRKKNASRPILKRALVTESHVIATDSYRLIRVRHNETIENPYLHEYTIQNDALDVSNYPDTSRLLPDTYNAKKSFTVNVQEWITAHDSGLVVAKQEKNKVISLNENGKLYAKDVELQTEYAYQLYDESLDIPKVSYNCQYMLDAMKTLKKLGYKEVTCYYYGSMRPLLFQTNDEIVDILILPVRTF